MRVPKLEEVFEFEVNGFKFLYSFNDGYEEERDFYVILDPRIYVNSPEYNDALECLFGLGEELKQFDYFQLNEWYEDWHNEIDEIRGHSQEELKEMASERAGACMIEYLATEEDIPYLLTLDSGKLRTKNAQVVVDSKIQGSDEAKKNAKDWLDMVAKHNEKRS